MNRDDGHWSEPDVAGPDFEQKERGGMIFVLIAGDILFTGGLFLAWKAGAFDMILDGIPLLKSGSSYDDYWRWRQRNHLLFFHAPWVFGAWMIQAAVKYFWKKRKP